MPEIVYPQESGEPVVVDLKDPYWAAFFAWAWPGAGHFYQRRYAKGFLFMICILSTYFLVLESDKVASYMPHSNQVICGGNLSVN